MKVELDTSFEGSGFMLVALVVAATAFVSGFRKLIELAERLDTAEESKEEEPA
jgi:hypothetical protein